MDTKHKDQLTASQKVAFTVEPLKDLTATGNITAGGNLTVQGAAAVAGGNITTQGKIQKQGHDLLPTGSIIMWSGAIDAIPPGWALCDGGTYTDSQGKSVQTPPLQNRFIVAAGGDYHAGSSGNYDTHTHTIDIPAQSFTTSTVGSHTHHFPSQWYNKGAKGGGDRTIIDTGGPPRYSIGDSTTQEAGKHHHTVSVHIGEFASHESQPGEIRPRWYALAFIMKL